jgi:SAM-dependent methyltransferase
MSKTYEELSGATGRARFFRPARYDAASLFSGAPPRAYFDDQEYSLVNLSGAGAGCQAPTSEIADLEAVNQRGVFRLVQRGKEIFRGAARQSRLNIALGRAVAGFALEGSQFDLTELQTRNARALAGDAEADPAARPAQEYRAFCADALEFIGGFMNRIDRHFGPIEESLSAEATAEIIAELDAAAAPGWRALTEAGNALVLGVHEDKRVRSVYKTYTERTVTREVIGGPGWARSFYKPLGYPGDFQIMTWIYDGLPQGDTIRAKFLHQLSLIGSKPVMTRMQALARILVDMAASRGQPAANFDIVSVGCGPAREIKPILEASGAQRWRATLVDQEPLALESALAFARSQPGASRLEARALNISFQEMLDPSPLSSAFSGADVIYSSGLVDYLNPMLAQRFVKRLYAFVRPGGSVIIGNVNSLPTGMIWSSEYAVDWSLFFRSRDDMEAMAAGVPDAAISVETDALNAIYFLIATKPA